jgi:hypothetical protein
VRGAGAGAPTVAGPGGTTCERGPQPSNSNATSTARIEASTTTPDRPADPTAIGLARVMVGGGMNF